MKRKFGIVSLIIILAICMGIFICHYFAKYNVIYDKTQITIIQNDWEYSVNKESKKATVKSYKGNDTNISIPEKIAVNQEEYTVTNIEANAFENCTNISKLSIPESVTNIEKGALDNCKELNNINIAKDSEDSEDVEVDNEYKNNNTEEEIYTKEYIEYLQLTDEEKAEVNVIPVKQFVSINTLNNKKTYLIGATNEQTESEELEESYDLREHINITVEDQEYSSWCWAYSSLKAIDTYSELNFDVDYNSSEAHLAHMRSYYYGQSLGLQDFSDEDEIYYTGGNFTDFSNYAKNRKFGPVLESEIPNTKYSFTEDNRSMLQNASRYINVLSTKQYPYITKEYQQNGTIIYKNGDTILTEAQVTEFRNTIKKHIMQNGGLYTAVQCPDTGTDYYNSSTAAYYWEGDQSQLLREGGHVVTIVGWDDTYSTSNFNAGHQPANDGAYLCLNSWGTYFGEEGYFYISYDDIGVEQFISGVIDAEEVPETIEITKLPDKTNFVQNYESLDLTGGEIKLTSKSGNEKVVSMTDNGISVSGYNNKIIGKNTITVSYNGYLNNKVSLDINIIEPTVTKIELDTMPTQTNYIKDYEELNLAGGKIKITYNQNDLWNSTLNMNNSNVVASELDNSTLGAKTITLTYKGKTMQISVNVVGIREIEIIQLPTKTIYMKNDTELNLKGGKIKVTFTSDETRLVDTTNTRVTIDTFDTSSLGKTEVKLVYCTHYVSFDIEVIENYFEYTKSGSYITITGYNGCDTEVIIPQYIYEDDVEYTVNKIGQHAFKDSTSITTVIISKNITMIESGAFGNCSSLSRIEIPASVTNFGENVFNGCNNVKIYTYSNATNVINYAQNNNIPYELFPNPLKSIAITNPPNKVEYNANDNFETNGMVVTATYNDGNTETISNYSVIDGDNLTAGTESVTISYTEDNITATATQNIKVNKLQGKITNITDVSKIYDGNLVSNPNFERVGDGEISFEWYRIEGTTVVKLSEAPINAGEYKVKVVMAVSVNYTRAEGEKTFTISKATYDMSNVSFTDASYTYDGTEKKIEITGTLPEGVSVEYKGNTKTDVGQSIATAIFTGDTTNHNEIPNMTATLTISAQAGSITNITDVSKVYNGDPVSNPNFERVGDGEISFEWYKIEGTTVVKLSEAPINAGEYKVKVVMAASNNYTRAEGEKTFSISKATYDMSNVSFTDANYTYDGTEKKIEITGTLPEGVSVEYKGNTKTDVGQSIATAIFTGDTTNHNEIPNMTAILTISAIQGSITNITDISKVYDGYRVSNPNFEKVGDGGISFEWYKIKGITAIKLNEAPVIAGNYKVKVVMAASINYSRAESEKEFTISKATPVYEAPTDLLAIEGDKLLDVKLPAGFEWEDDLNTSVGEFGEHTFTAKYTPQDTENYNIITGIKLKITVIENIEIDFGNYEEVEENGIGYIENIPNNTTIDEIKEEIKNGTVEIYKGDSKIEEEDTKIATGMEIRVTLKNDEVKSYQAVVKGDISGDGEIDQIDLLMLARYMAHFQVEKGLIKGAYLRATDIVGNNSYATDGDLLKLARVLAHLDNL